MKKFILALICFLFVATLASCATGGAKDGKVHVTFYHTMGANLKSVLDKYVEKFNEIYPNIVIDHEAIGGYDDVRDQVKTKLQAGEHPAIAYCYPDHVATYLLSGQVIDMNTYIKSTSEMDVTPFGGTGTVYTGLTQEQVDDFVEGYYVEGLQYGDSTKMYSLPFSKSTEVLYYNKTMFEEHNISVPTTWDEMEAVIKQLKDIDPNSIPLGYDSEANWFITMTEQLKTPYTQAVKKVEDRFVFNNEQNRAFVERFVSWCNPQDGKTLCTTQGIYGKYTSGLFVNLDKNDKGQVIRSYMSIGSSAGATHQCPEKDSNNKYPFEVGIATIPQADASNKKVISQGPSVTMLKQADSKVNDAAWLFIKYLLTNANFQAEFSMASGYVPVLKSAFNLPAYQTFLEGASNNLEGIAALSAKVCMEQEAYYFTSPAFEGSSDARDQVGNLMINALSGKDSVQSAFDKAVNKCVSLNKE